MPCPHPCVCLALRSQPCPVLHSRTSFSIHSLLPSLPALSRTPSPFFCPPPAPPPSAHGEHAVTGGHGAVTMQSQLVTLTRAESASRRIAAEALDFCRSAEARGAASRLGTTSSGRSATFCTRKWAYESKKKSNINQIHSSARLGQHAGHPHQGPIASSKSLNRYTAAEARGLAKTRKSEARLPGSARRPPHAPPQRRYLRTNRRSELLAARTTRRQTTSSSVPRRTPVGDAQRGPRDGEGRGARHRWAGGAARSGARGAPVRMGRCEERPQPPLHGAAGACKRERARVHTYTHTAPLGLSLSRFGHVQGDPRPKGLRT